MPVEAKTSWVCPAPRGVILEFPANIDRVQGTRVRIFDEENGKQIITITDLAIYINAEGLTSVEAEFLGGARETYELAGIRIRTE